MLHRTRRAGQTIIITRVSCSAAVVVVAFVGTLACEMRACQQRATMTSAVLLTISPHTCIRRQPLASLSKEFEVDAGQQVYY
jgi:hypothetical protein